MSKELTPLESLKKVEQWYSVEKINTLKPYNWKQIRDLLPSECDIIESALKEYETLQDDFNKLYERTYKEHKAFEIIKDKPIVALVDYKYKYEEWLELVDEKDKDLFRNKEEYELLKEVLE